MKNLQAIIRFDKLEAEPKNYLNIKEGVES